MQKKTTTFALQFIFECKYFDGTKHTVPLFNLKLPLYLCNLLIIATFTNVHANRLYHGILVSAFNVGYLTSRNVKV